MALLEVRNLVVRYGHIEAVRGVDLSVDAGEVAALVGANGAGKSSTLLALSGLVPWRGSIRFDGHDISGLPPHRLAERGLVHLPEGRAILASLSVRENLELGAYPLKLNASKLRDAVAAQLERFPVLKGRLDERGGNLSGGEQQMLALARALIARPRLLLLDEPSMGLAPLKVQEIFRLLADIHAAGVPILLVEQNVRLALKLARRGWVLENGAISLEGSSDELLAHPELVAAYLGTTRESAA